MTAPRLTAPRVMQHTAPFEADDEALQDRLDGVSLSSSHTLEGLHRQRIAPRTPLLPSMDLFQSPGLTHQKSNVDTLPPLESVPPPAPYPSEPPPARPSVVPPVRLPRSNPPPAMYTAPLRQSNPPPAMNALPATPSSEPPRERLSSAPPRERFSSAPPPSSTSREMRRVSANPPSPYAATAPQAHSTEALRREAPTIPADARSVSQPPAYDPTYPIPSLRVPNFDPQNFGADPFRRQENRRIGSVAFVLLVGLLIVTGAVMGINFVAKGSRERTQTATEAPAEAVAPKVNLERLAPNAVVAPPAFNQSQGSTPPNETATASVGATPTAQAREPSARSSDPTSLGSPWSQPAKTVSKSRTSQPKTVTSAKGSRKRLDPKSIDTETPIIMD